MDAVAALLAIAPGALLRLAPDGRVLDASGSAAASLAMGSLDRLLGRPVVDLVDPDNREAVQAALGQAATGVPAHVGFACTRALDQREVDARIAPLQTKDDEVVELLMALLPRRDDHAALAAAREEEARLRQIIDLVPHFIFAKDREGRFILANEAVARALGTTPESLLGRTDADMNADAEQVAHFRNEDLQVIASGRPRFVAEERLTDSEGNVRLLQTIKIPFRCTKTRSDAVLGVAVDISAQRRAEAERDALFTHSQDLLSVSDLRGRLRQINPAWSAVTGHPEAEILQRNWVEWIHPEDRIAALRMAARLRRGEPVRDVETRFQRADGDWLVLAWNAFPVPDRGLAYGIARDVTAMRQAEDRRRQLEEGVHRSQRLDSLGKLAGGIAHELNNLLAVVLGSAQLLEMDLAEDAPGRSWLGAITNSAQKAGEFCKQLRAYATGDVHRAQKQRLDLSTVVGEIGDITQRITAPHAVLSWDLPADLPFVEADLGQMQQVVLNLVTNAVESIGDENDGVVHIRIRHGEFDAARLAAVDLEPRPAPGPYVVLSVHDDGCGIAPDLRPTVFEPFVTTKPHAHGLGLFAARQIVERHDGALGIESEPGEGTVVSIYLPARRRPADAPVAPQGAPVGPWRGSGALLVVDDEDDVRAVVAEQARRLGFTVSTAQDGEDAVAQVAEDPAAWVGVLMDVAMPRLDGRLALARMKALRADLPVVLMSGHLPSDLPEDPASLPDGFLLKPFPTERLQRALQNALTA